MEFKPLFQLQVIGLIFKMLKIKKHVDQKNTFVVVQCEDVSGKKLSSGSSSKNCRFKSGLVYRLVLVLIHIHQDVVVVAFQMPTMSLGQFEVNASLNERGKIK